MFKKKLFGAAISPACAHCEHGDFSADGRTILCLKKGVVGPNDRCGRYVYAPLKRKPLTAPKLPVFEKSDFEI